MNVHTRSILVCLLLILSLSLLGCTGNSTTNLHLTSDQLTEAGFYTYLIPEQDLRDSTWSRDIYTYSLDIHCKSVLPSRHVSPIETTYKDAEGNVVLRIKVVPFDDVIDRRSIVNRILLEAEWLPSGEGKYGLRGDDETTLILRDQFDMEVIISSTAMGLGELVELVEHLEYVGPPQTEVDNPWHNICE